MGLGNDPSKPFFYAREDFRFESGSLIGKRIDERICKG
ncbi:hypothetical protein LEP1GSC052_3111 [Leptospira kmetyi serovar Malaysia str. Bejo-Iso9]|nr:hypothetical protein LEP1GSC052_3111 [Leptospira kmetyi serovar Malaysia str. Bejo-Iso9]